MTLPVREGTPEGLLNFRQPSHAEVPTRLIAFAGVPHSVRCSCDR